MKRKGWVFVLLAALAVFSPALAQQNGKAIDDQNGIPPEQALKEAPKILGADEAPSAFNEDIAYYPYNSSLGYKGVLMGEFDYYDEADELLVDFGSVGVWYYNGGSWSQQSGLNAESMISAVTIDTADEEAVFDFGATGLWYWNEGYWTQLSGANAQGMFSVDDDFDTRDEIQVDFGTLGVWRYDWDDSSWTQLSGLNPYNGLRMDVGGPGYEEGCWSFSSVGVWNIYKSNTGSNLFYTQLTGTVNGNDDHTSAHFTNTAGAEDLVMDFGTLGIWLYRETWGPWYQISGMDPNRIKEVKFVGGSQDYELLAHDNAGGLYWGNWNGSTFVWTLITSASIGPGWCETFDKDGADSGDEEVIIPASAGGAYIFDYSAGSTFNQWIGVGTNWHINFMVKGDYYTRGYDSTLAVAFSSTSDNPGLWTWDQTAGWVKISGNVPDGFY